VSAPYDHILAISWPSLQVCATPAVQEAGMSFLLSVARVEQTRGMMALCGAFGVLVECASRPTCPTHIEQKCSLVIDALVKEADQPVKKLLEAYQSRSICEIGLFSVFTHLAFRFQNCLLDAEMKQLMHSSSPTLSLLLLPPVSVLDQRRPWSGFRSGFLRATLKPRLPWVSTMRSYA
jgi:hypothetical protein